MAWPPTIPPNTRQNTTPELDNHPSDHNTIADALTAIVTQVNATATPTPWTAIPMTAPWVAYGQGYQAPQYRRIGDMVYLRGVANKGSNMVVNEIFGTVPAGFTPPAKVQCLAIVGAAIAVNLEIDNTGTIRIAGFVTTGPYLVLDSAKGWSTAP